MLLLYMSACYLVDKNRELLFDLLMKLLKFDRHFDFLIGSLEMCHLFFNITTLLSNIFSFYDTIIEENIKLKEVG